jgi:CubicO group peptidase (beta-lactamase class C family)
MTHSCNAAMLRLLLTLILACARLSAASDLKTDLHNYFQKACQSQHFMGVASLSIDGKMEFTDACGWADAEWNIPNATDTRFRTGSIAKQFTAAGVLLLYEEGKLALSDPIGKHLPDLPEAWRSATVHQLLTHTSGIPIPDYHGPAWERYSALGTNAQDFLDLVRDKALLYPHGTKVTYNNTGYILLGMLIEKLSGMKYEDFVQQRIFNQLGMKNSGFDDVNKIIPHRARGYTFAGAQLQNATFLDPRSAWSAGGFYSTVHDLTLWSESLAHGKLLNTDSTRRMFDIYPETAAYGMHYGYAQVIGERFGHKLQYHGGGITGFNSVLQRYPEVGLVIVVFSNVDSDSSPGTLTSWAMGDGLAKIWFESQSHQ